MGLIVDVSKDVAELYVRRFCVTRTDDNLVVARMRCAPLLDFAEIGWHVRSSGSVFVWDVEPIERLSSAHFNAIQAHSAGFSQLLVWFPPRTQPLGDECRLLIRAGVRLNL